MFKTLSRVTLTHQPFPPAVAHPILICLNGVFASGQWLQPVLTKMLQIGKWFKENNPVIIVLSQVIFRFGSMVVKRCSYYSNMLLVQYDD